MSSNTILISDLWDAIKLAAEIEFDRRCNFPEEVPDFSSIKFDKNKLNGRSYSKG